jgi:hypothetical protein
MILTSVSNIRIGDATTFAVTCSSINPLTDAPTCTKNTDGKYEITGAFDSNINTGVALRISLTPVKNPQIVGTESLQLLTYTDNTFSYQIDKATTGIVPVLSCDYPCRTCISGEKSKCLSCFTDVAEIPEKYYFSPTNTCIIECPAIDGYVNLGKFQCVKCDSNCKTCDNLNLVTCLSCDQAGLTPFLYQNICLPTCPSTTY